MFLSAIRFSLLDSLILLSLLISLTACAQNESSAVLALENGASSREPSFNLTRSDALSNESDTPQNYTLIPGDIIQITVLEEASLTLSTQLDEGGSVTYPYLGRLNVEGMTLGEVRELITFGLDGDYLLDPNVHITMETYRDFYISGEIADPGNFPYRPGLTLNKAIALGGGFTERAARTKIAVTSEDQDQADRVIVDLDYMIQPGDVITVPRRFF
ncbi:MAG: protein involved in polysaccharide export with SLBB domain [Cellvibrionaceae bacterium]|jgi:protein involved in polysaccharide export with SLBB domain